MAQMKQRVKPLHSSKWGPSKRLKTFTYTILIHPADPDETGYWVEVPALRGCFTQGETIEECLSRAEEAIRCYVEGLVEEGQTVPEEPSQEGAVVSEVKLKLPVPA